MPLVEDINQINYNAAGAALITQAQNLLTQRASLTSQIQTLRPIVKADIEQDIWNRAQVTELMDLYRVRDDVDVQLGNTKTEMQAIRAVIANTTYHDEIYAQEQLIP